MDQMQLQAVREACRELVRKRARLSGVAAAVPVPMLDVVVDGGILLDLLPEVSHRFGLGNADIAAMPQSRRERVWQAIRDHGAEFIGVMLTRELIRKTILGYVGRFVARQVTKFIPFGGTLVAASLGYLVLREIGYRHVEDCYAVAKAALPG